MFPPTLTTERLTLRPVRLEDAEVHNRRIAKDAEVTKYLSGIRTGTLLETQEFLRKSVEEFAAGDGAVWAIEWRNLPVSEDEGSWGTVGVARCGPQLTLGYALAQAMWGQGLMTEAASAVVSAMWRLESVWRIEAICHVDHKASARVLEKCGLRREGIARRRLVMPKLGPEPQDCLVYAQVRDDVIT